MSQRIWICGCSVSGLSTLFLICLSQLTPCRFWILSLECGGETLYLGRGSNSWTLIPAVSAVESRQEAGEEWVGKSSIFQPRSGSKRPLQGIAELQQAMALSLRAGAHPGVFCLKTDCGAVLAMRSNVPNRKLGSKVNIYIE